MALALVATNQQIVGAAISRDTVEVWQVNDVEAVQTKLNSVLVEIGLVRQQAGQLPSTVTSATAAWRRAVADLHTLLFPPAAQQLIANAKRLIIAPNDRLWYVPYEMLPEGGVAEAEPWLARRAITYVPTLGSLRFAFAPQPDVKQTLGVVDVFFAINKDNNEQLAELLIQGVPKSSKLSLTQKVAAPSSQWLRICVDQLWVASEIDILKAGWDADLIPLGRPNPSQLGSWLRTPIVSPSRILLPGLRTSMSSGQLKNGNDLFLPTCGLLFGGSRSAVISRWPAGGKSSQRLLLRCMEEFPHEPASQALRRSVLALWAEEFLTADEPVLLPAGKEAEHLTSGRHPLLWSGYMSLGDNASTP